MRKLLVAATLLFTAITANAAAAKPKPYQLPKVVKNKSRVRPVHARTIKTAKVRMANTRRAKVLTNR